MEPRTRAEATGYEETSRHADVMAFLAALAARNDPRLWIGSMGTSPGGRELPLVVANAHGVRTPEEARRRGLPVVLVLNGIHAGEVEGKEASLALLRDLLAGPDGALLERLVLVVVPLFNPDGNDALDPGNRRLDLPKLSGQVGPALVGTRVNAAKVNLNRDYLRQEAPESRLLSKVVQAWAPDLTLDNHATNGSVHRFSMTVDVPHTVASGRPEPIEHMRARFVPAVAEAVRRGHGLESGWYGNFVEDERALEAAGVADPSAAVREGWMTYPHHPRFGSNYRGLTNRLDLLLEAYAYVPFEERVRAARAWIVESLRYVAAHADELVGLVEACRLPRASIAVRSRLEALPEPVEILTRTPRTLDGAPSSVRLPYLARFVGSVVVERPPAYLVPPRVASHLAAHGLAIEDPPAGLDAEVATVESIGAEGGRKILEAAEVGELGVTWKRATRPPPAGVRLVRTAQPLGAIGVYLCEPESDDGAAENGLVDPPALGTEWPIWRAFL